MSEILFIILLVTTSWFFARSTGRIRKNILLGRKEERNDRSSERWKTMFKVAFGQSKMVARPIVGVLHFFIYAGFIIVNIEILEIIIDGISGNHRVFAPLLPAGLYNSLTVIFEFFATSVLLACIIFLIRRNMLRIKRFWSPEMKWWPRTDANLILITEILLMSAFLIMNASDSILQQAGRAGYITAGLFPVSAYLTPLLHNLDGNTLVFIERFCWWFHIVFIFIFLNYIPYSKHFHIVLAFPNTYYSKLDFKGRLNNMDSVTNEVKLMIDPSATPPTTEEGLPQKFGAKDVTDLSWKQLMDAYSCTECGRCTSECPANMTGKKLSPRKIMMDTRDRLEEVGKQISKAGEEVKDGKSLLFDYISEEELWACTSCNACAQACPVNIDPLSIIIDLRRFLVMEQSSAPAEVNMMFSNIENNGAPWKFSPADRFNWAEELKG